MLSSLTEAIGAGLRRIRPGLDAIVFNASAFARLPATIEVTSRDFEDGRPMPAKFTGDGPGLSPPLRWAGVPEDARELVLLVEDADAPFPRPLVHAIALGLPAGDGELAEGELPNTRRGKGTERMGRNSVAARAWLPPTPPPRHGPHRYCFQLFALDRAASFPHPPGRGLLVSTMRGHVLARGLLIGTYERP